MSILLVLMLMLYMSPVFSPAYYGGPKVSWQFQFTHGNFNYFVHSNFNLLTAISICSRQFQFTHSNFNFNLFMTISIYSWQFQFHSQQFQFTHGNFNFFMAMLTAFFALLTTCLLRRLTVATKSQNQKSKFKVDLRVSD